MANRKMGVTGCMYVDIERMQVRQTLEGPRDVVLALYAKIKADGRHFVFEEDLEPVTQRHFSCWGMKDMSELEVPAYMEPSRARPPSPNAPKLLKCRPLRGQKSLKCKAATRPKSLKCN